MAKNVVKLSCFCLCLCFCFCLGWGISTSSATAQAAAYGEVIPNDSPEYGSATSFLFSLPAEVTGITAAKGYQYRVESSQFTDSQAPCFLVYCTGKNRSDDQLLVVAADNSQIYRTRINEMQGESSMERIYPTATLKKLKTEEEALQHLQEYFQRTTSENKKFAAATIVLDPNSRADGLGTWSIEAAVGEDHEDHFVALAHFRLFNNGVIQQMDILSGDYQRVN